MSEFIYLDNNATTPLDPLVLEKMLPYLKDVYANAASNHKFGKIASDAVGNARNKVAGLIGSDDKEIIFTSGASEGVNLAMKGTFMGKRSARNHLVTVVTEHQAVLDTSKYLEQQGVEVTYLPVQPDGLVNLDLLRESIREDTALVSLMYVNNETGVIQPIKEIAEFAHKMGAYFMTDATQAVGKIPLNVRELEIDLMPFSAHKFYGPKGVGGLYVKNRGTPRVQLSAIIHGGGHEKGLRSGTLNVPGIVGMGEACSIAEQEIENDSKRIQMLRDTLEQGLLTIPQSFVNGSTLNRLYNVSNIRFDGADADAIMIALENITVSNGSACTSTSVDPSHVLAAMGLSELDAFSSIRFSLGRFNSKEDVEKVINAMRQIVGKLRMMTQA